MTDLDALCTARAACLTALRSIGCRTEAADALKRAIDVLDAAIGQAIAAEQHREERTA